MLFKIVRLHFDVNISVSVVETSTLYTLLVAKQFPGSGQSLLLLHSHFLSFFFERVRALC